MVAISPTERTVTESVNTGAIVFTGKDAASTELDKYPTRTCPLPKLTCWLIDAFAALAATKDAAPPP